MEKTIREALEEREETLLSPFACRSAGNRGRLLPEEECPLRPAFQRDRDRIIHSKAFRRLKDKTQVFLVPTGDHYRTRLTHTLEVSQIARTLSKALRLNEDLTEAIALAHDLGHTPFGHSGEGTLNEVVPGGFNHAEQSLRVVDLLERDGRGLNLTFEVRDGIQRHTKGKGDILCRDPALMASTLEGQVVRISDIIAYINHDIDDALRSGVIDQSDLPSGCIRILGERHSGRINTMVGDIVRETLRQGGGCLAVSPGVLSAMVELREFLWSRVYENETVHCDFRKASKILKELYVHFSSSPEAFLAQIGRPTLYDSLERCVADFLAGMTDRYAFHLYEKLFLPLPWGVV
jgi:dGTPase